MFTSMCIPSLQPCLQHFNIHVYTLFKDILPHVYRHVCRHVYRHVYTIFENLFNQCRKTCLPYVWRRVYPMFKDTLTQCLKTWFCHVWKKHNLSNMFTKWLKHVYTIIENIFTAIFAMFLAIHWRQCHNYVWRHINPYIKTCLMYEDIMENH